ncbi:MAG: prenyltransferase [Pirellula sp.]|nr:prenyltransferase [Pirellula sp.]
MRLVAAAVGAALWLGLVLPSSAQAEVTAEQVRRSIDDAVGFLERQQKPDGSWEDYLNYPGGTTALCTLSLLTAGVEVGDPVIQKALAYLRTLDPKLNYVVSLQTMVLAAAEPQKDLALIVRNVKLLESRQHRDDRSGGSWAYENPSRIADNSNAQFVLLALHEAERAGVTTSEATWRLARDYWERSQNADGSWGYFTGQPGSGSMTCAGISALLMAREKLAEGDAKVSGETVECCVEHTTDNAIARAMGWLGRNFSVYQNPGDAGHILYYLYGLERVGRLTNSRLIGNHDWYREGAEALVRRQAQLGGGAWIGAGSGEQTPIVGTCFALLFLAKGRRPVLAAKLEFDPQPSWDNHRHDLANLTRYCEKKWQRELTWQVMRSKLATVDDLNQAPVLYISGSKAPAWSDAELKILRQYLDLGGFIFAENCCGGNEFDAGFRAMLARMFPDRDERGTLLYQLRPLPLEHSVWNAEEPVDPKHMRPLEGLDVGCRTSVIYCPQNLGCYWELDRLGRKQRYPEAVEAEIRAVRSIGINVLAYATNREVKYKLEIPHILADSGKPDAVERAKLYIAELKHGGGSNIAPTALVNLLKQLSLDTGLRVSTEKRELSPLQDEVFDHHLVFMHGRSSFSFSDAERKQLRLFVERGGLIFADAICSSEEFAASFRREMGQIFSDAPLRPIPASSEMFGEKFGGFALGQVTLRDPRRGNGAGPLRFDVIRTSPELEGVQLGNRYGVIFSKYDLSCALERHNSLECAGYNRDDAARIGINVILFSLRGNL